MVSLHPPIFEIFIRDGTEKPLVKAINPDGTSKPWCLLARVGSKCYIYDWGTEVFRQISYPEYCRYRTYNHSLEIKHQNSDHVSLLPTSKAVEKVYEGEPVTKQRHCALAELGDLRMFEDKD